MTHIASGNMLKETPFPLATIDNQEVTLFFTVKSECSLT